MDPLTAILEALLPTVTPPRAIEPDTSRPMNAAELKQYAAGRLLRLEGEWKTALGEAMKYAAEAAADPDFYADLAKRCADDAAEAEKAYLAECATYRNTTAGNAPRNDDGN
jgi:hypothetical protein